MAHVIKKLIITAAILCLPCHSDAGIIDYAVPAATLTASGFVVSSIPAYKEMQKMRALCRRQPSDHTLQAEFEAARKTFITRLSAGGIAGIIAFILWLKKPPVQTNDLTANATPEKKDAETKPVPALPVPPVEVPAKPKPDAATEALIAAAINENDTDALRALNDTGILIDADNLAAAITNGSDPKTLTFLIKECGVDVDGNDSAALKAALKKEDWDAVRLLTDNGASIDVLDEYDRTPLMIAAENNDVALAKILRGRGVDMDEPDKYGYTPLHRAATRGSLEFVQFLVNSRANVNALDQRGATPLHSVISRYPTSGRRRIEILKLLLDSGADIHATASRRDGDCYKSSTILDAARILCPADSLTPVEDDVVWFIESEMRRRG
ncbi:MAG: hypothetical protein QG604_834 [Candidatus Dependentiae bacterium]|nr:hypothetical protein [Candidatus Dependentiae bacterium]